MECGRPRMSANRYRELGKGKHILIKMRTDRLFQSFKTAIRFSKYGRRFGSIIMKTTH